MPPPRYIKSQGLTIFVSPFFMLCENNAKTFELSSAMIALVFANRYGFPPSLIYDCKITEENTYDKKTRGSLYEPLVFLYVMNVIFRLQYNNQKLCLRSDDGLTVKLKSPGEIRDFLVVLFSQKCILTFIKCFLALLWPCAVGHYFAGTSSRVLTRRVQNFGMVEI